MDELGFFRSIGLTDKEVSVYMALLSLGQSTIGDIGKESKVSKSKIYDILDRLIAKGFVSHLVKGGVKWFSASDPNMILSYLDRKERELDARKKEAAQLIPSLSLLRKSKGRQPVAEVYEGFEAFAAIRGELLPSLKKGDELLVLGAPRIANERWEGYLLKFHASRETRGVGMRIIYNIDARKYGDVRRKFRLTKVRYLPSDMLSPNWVEMYKDTIIIGLILKEALFFVVRDPSVTASFRSYFDMIWALSKE